ncbi:hypothetical protein ACFVWR_14395 [Leifsonia sp. NPDC058292]|uniref:hypothetical protein n=1 Tax=Leifsonia sp. NPDC058292 TaxID=3346428 RepID=UPI0036DA5C9C|nr:hypothetical protein [Schumannella sp.]
MTKKRLVLNKRTRSVIRVAASGLAAGALAVYLAIPVRIGAPFEWLPLLIVVAIGSIIGIVVAGHATIRPRLLALTSIVWVVLAALAFCAPRWISAGRYDGTLPTATECVGGATSVTQWPILATGGKKILGQAELIYSGQCGTAWVRVSQTPPDSSSTKSIARPAGDLLPPAATRPETDPYSNLGTFGRQLVAPGCVVARVTVSENGAIVGASRQTVCR